MSGSPTRGGWQVLDLAAFADRLLSGASRSASSRPWLIAVDGHSASGKTTLSQRLAERLPRAAVLHGDDLAWHHSVFDWRPLLVDGVLAPLRAGQQVRYRPPAWVERDRPGAIEVPAGLDVLILEGVGASRRDLQDMIAVSIWVEAGEAERLRRDEERMAAGEVTRQVYDDWMAVENPFLAADRPWSRADVVVAGDSSCRTTPVRRWWSTLPGLVASGRPGPESIRSPPPVLVAPGWSSRPRPWPLRPRSTRGRRGRNDRHGRNARRALGFRTGDLRHVLESLTSTAGRRPAPPALEPGCGARSPGF